MSLKQALIGLFLLTASVPAHAFEIRASFGGGHPWHSGHWTHDRYHGRLGWYWVVGPHYYYYPRPVPAPQTVIIEQPPQPAPVTVVQPAPQVIAQAPAPSPVLYYCKATATYYPDTMTCPGGWSTQTAGLPPQ